jgi:NTE family protein
MTVNMRRPQDADLVLQGGGVKGIALAGAVVEFMRGHRIRRVAGTSAGAILASLVAAGFTADEVKEAMASLRYDKVPDSRPNLPLLTPALSFLTQNGLFQGDFIHDWVRRQLESKGVRTFRDLRLQDTKADPALSGDRGYRLVVTATDVTRGRSLRLPWDYREGYGLDPDDQLVADAVRMSLSIPLFFTPQELVDQRTKHRSTIVDGGVLTNFPVEIFDREDGRLPRWPTFGIGVIPDLPGADSTLMPRTPIPGPIGLLTSVATAAVVGHDQTYLDRPRNARRLVRIDTSGVGIVSFGIKRAARQRLFDNGQEAARNFLQDWDWQAYCKEFGNQSTA